jgi:hypothetical protein
MRNESMPSGREEQSEQIPLDFESAENEGQHYMSFENVISRVNNDEQFKDLWKNEQAINEKANDLQQLMDHMAKQKEWAHLLQTPDAIYFIAKKFEKVTPEEQEKLDRFDPDINR